ncbi:hypothetical protein ACOJUR_12435 [Alicyclobacillus tolerans]|uniref:hypothetical protein n=1 Tax=Alicyclobacillus tolerans TaxID=90970 RepID=UPI003B76FD1C
MQISQKRETGASGLGGLDAFAIELQSKLADQAEVRANTEALLDVVAEMLTAFDSLQVLQHQWERAADRAERMAVDGAEVDAAMVGRAMAIHQCLYDLENALSPLVAARKKYAAALGTLRHVRGI